MAYLGEDGQIPFVSKSEIKSRVDELLEECWDGAFPVDVERMCDHFDISILPVAGLTDCFQIDAYISADFKTIYVDAEKYKDESPRYRFSVAHELGHYILHREYYSSRVESFGEWRAASYKSANYFAEYQANYFAGCLLAPENELIRVLNVGFDGSFARSYFSTRCEELGRIMVGMRRFFRVSEQVIHRRMRDVIYGLN
ncbi:ImmA/IrrE family metallo-endopeptidase [Candidatus Saccharibacteria bacterium]|nr:ImmA/IrrE family metallo-endopeptidase [Candidatus Saccharibacteria bacterium]